MTRGHLRQTRISTTLTDMIQSESFDVAGSDLRDEPLTSTVDCGVTRGFRGPDGVHVLQQ